MRTITGQIKDELEDDSCFFAIEDVFRTLDKEIHQIATAATRSVYINNGAQYEDDLKTASFKSEVNNTIKLIEDKLVLHLNYKTK